MKPRTPQPLTDDHDTRLTGFVLISGEEAPCYGLDSKGREITRRRDFAVQALREVKVSVASGLTEIREHNCRSSTDVAQLCPIKTNSSVRVALCLTGS